MSSPKKNKAFINEQTTMITSNVNATAVYNDDESYLDQVNQLLQQVSERKTK